MTTPEDGMDDIDVFERVAANPHAWRSLVRLMRAHRSRGFVVDVLDLSAKAHALFNAPRDPLAGDWRACIRMRHGLRCDDSKCCNCDIPF